jgi:hypothetical protein
MAEYNQYCDIPANSPWFPTPPGATVETLPPAPETQTNSGPIPANSVVVDELFDPDSVDLCNIFDSFLDSPSPPVYDRSLNVSNVLPPYLETIYILCGLRVRTLLSYINYPPFAVVRDLESRFFPLAEVEKVV